MMPPEPAFAERQRLRVLADFGVLDTGPDDVLDKLVALAAAIGEAPIALISLVDETRLWFKARFGLAGAEMPREGGFCAHAIAAATDLFIVPDARTDPRFADHPYVTGAPHIVFYAGVPLVVAGGAKLGTLCIIDRKPRPFTPLQKQTLTTLAQLVVRYLEDRRKLAESAASEGRLQTALASIGDAVLTAHAKGLVTFEKLVAGKAIAMAPHSFAVPDDAGELMSLATLVRDQRAEKVHDAERRRLADETEAARARLAAVFANAPAFVATLRGPEHVFELANPEYSRVVGATRKIVGLRAADALPEVVAQGLIALLDRVYQTGEPFLGKEFLIPLDRAGDGQLADTYFNFVYQPSRDATGTIDGIDVFGFDVTEQVSARKRVEVLAAALDNERYRLKTVVDSSPFSIAIWRGEDFVFELVNRNYQAAVPDRVLIGRARFDVLPELKTQGFPAIFARLWQTGAPFIQSELPVTMAFHKDAPVETRYFDAVYVRMDNQDGSAYGIYHSSLDVTDRVQTRQQLESSREKLRRSEEKVRRLVEAAGVGLWDFDTATLDITTDARMVELMGLPPGSQINLSTGFGEMFSPEDRDRVVQAVEGACAGKNAGRYTVDFRAGGHGGSPLRWLESRAQVYFDDAGKPIRLAGAMIDITARKVLEEERQRWAARVTEILDSTSDGFFSLDGDAKFTAVNRTFERLSRMSREQILGKIFWDVFPHTANRQSPEWINYQTCVRDRVPIEFVSHYAPTDTWVDTRAMPTADGGVAVFFRDVTEKNRAEAALVERSAFERQLIGIVSHDLRNPLNVILMASDLLHSQDSLDAVAVKNVARIAKAAERANRLVRDLLDFTQARLAGGIPANRQPGDFHALTRAVVDEVAAAYSDRAITVHAEGDGAGDWDSDRIGQVVQNLVTNALKYSAEGSRVAVSTRGEDDAVTLTVHNEGIPIPSATLPVIFEPFERGADHKDAAARSVGLGLYIVKQVVSAHGGTISVRSHDGEGTTFVVRIPRRAVVDAVPGQERTGAEVE